MLPPPGLEPSLASLLENASPTLLSTAIATATSILSSTPSLTATAASLAATATSISHSPHTEHKPPPPENGECSLLGPFAIFVQGALGLAALMALVYKRWRERPQRPMKIWFFDVSKQVVGSVLVHIANLLMSMLSSGQFSIALDPATVTRGIERRKVDSHGKYRPNPCSFYLLNLAIDTTIGIPILIVLLRVLTALFAMTPVGNPRESIESGHYGHPPKAYWWFKQSMIYFLGLMGMKVCVLIIFLLLPWISRVGDWALRWTEGDEVLQVVFVMLVFPVIMNATQYYIIDSFIKNQKPDHERIPEEDGEGDEGRFVEDVGGSGDEMGSGDEDDEILAKAAENKKTRTKITANPKKGSSSRPSSGQKSLKTANKDYDPMLDGESSPTVVGSASGSERDRLMAKDADSGDEPTRK